MCLSAWFAFHSKSECYNFSYVGEHSGQNDEYEIEKTIAFAEVSTEKYMIEVYFGQLRKCLYLVA